MFVNLHLNKQHKIRNGKILLDKLFFVTYDNFDRILPCSKIKL